MPNSVTMPCHTVPRCHATQCHDAMPHNGRYLSTMACQKGRNVRCHHSAIQPSDCCQTVDSRQCHAPLMLVCCRPPMLVCHAQHSSHEHITKWHGICIAWPQIVTFSVVCLEYLTGASVLTFSTSSSWISQNVCGAVNLTSMGKKEP